MIKILPNGSWVESVNHFSQTPEQNLSDIASGFINNAGLTKSELIEICTKCMNWADLTNVLVILAEFIIKELSDKEFALRVYEKAQSKVINVLDVCVLAESLILYMNETDWSLDLLSQTKAFVNESSDTLSVLVLAETYLKIVHDNDEANKLFDIAYKSAKTPNDLQLFTNSVLNVEKDDISILKQMRAPVKLFNPQDKN